MMDQYDKQQISQIADGLGDLAELQKASSKWYWRLIGIIVALAMVTSAIFQALSFFYC